MPRLVLICHAAAGDNLIALNTPGGEFVLVTSGTINLLFARDEALCADRILTDHAAETLLVPLSGLVFHFLSASTEDLATSIATAGELGVVAVAAIDLVHLATKLFVHQRHSAPIAEEAGFMPMLVLIRQILGVNADDFAAFLAAIGEYALVTLNAVRMLVSENVTLSC